MPLYAIRATILFCSLPFEGVRYHHASLGPIRLPLLPGPLSYSSVLLPELSVPTTSRSSFRWYRAGLHSAARLALFD